MDLVTFRNDIEPRKCKNIKDGKARENDMVLYNDYSPFMLIGQSSFDDLSKRMENKISMRQFRPNFVATGCAAYSEVILFQNFMTIKKKSKKLN